MTRLNNKGFSLVELLAVVTILGVLMAIAIPNVSSMIEKSRKQAYLEIVKVHQRNIEKLVSSDEYYVYDPDTVYYFDYRLGNEDDDAESSPFGDWVNCWVAVTFKNDKLNYYWFGVDTAGWKIEKKNKTVDKLTIKDIIHSNDTDMLPGASIGGRDKIVKYHLGEDTEGEKTEASNNVSSEEAKKCFSFKPLADGTYSITNYDVAKCGKEVDVPSSIDNKLVTIIDDNAFRNKGITKVILYYGIKEVKNGAFQNNKITDLKLSSSITTISDFAFYNNKLKEVDFPEGLEYINTYAFAYNQLTSINLSTSIKQIGSYAFYGNKLSSMELKSDTTVGSAAFSNNSMPPSGAIIYKYDKNKKASDYTTIVGYAGGEKNIVIPEQVNGVTLTTISSNAFASCGLTSVSIPDSVTYIGGAAFYNNQLKAVTLPKRLKYIGSSAFRENNLTDINIPPTVTFIGGGAFKRNCITGENKIIYARTASGSTDYSTIVSAANGRCGSNTITIPATKNGVVLKKIKGGAFSEFSYKSITMPNLNIAKNLTIEANAFYHNNLSGDKRFIYRISNGKVDYSTLDSYAGMGSGTLEIPSEKNGVKLKTINSRIVWKSYSTIVIPSTVTSIVGSAFTKTNSCNPNLTKIVNKTGRSFNWYQLTGSTYKSTGTFAEGIVKHQSGDILITAK